MEFNIKFGLLLSLLALILYLVTSIIRNLYFHSLSRFPGSRMCAATRLPLVRSLLDGSHLKHTEKLHRKYGPIVRVAPNELSFAHPDAWNDIFRPQREQLFVKDPAWWPNLAGQPDSLVTMQPEAHARMRKLLEPGFTKRSLDLQEPIIQKYVSLLIAQLQQEVMAESAASSGKRTETEIDMLPWFSFTTFDIFGDLAFAESFDCLRHSKYHPWIELLYNHIKATSFFIVAGFYPIVKALLEKLIPRSMLKMLDDHTRQIADKVQRRLNLEVERPDLMSTIARLGSDEKRGFSIEEINSTFGIMTTAGSETLATMLSATMNYLAVNPQKLEILTQEVRNQFSSDADIHLSGLRNLPYLNAVINEGLRLVPPVPFIPPHVVPAGGASICGSWIPGGTLVSISPWTLCRDTERFYESATFLPERWLPEATEEGSPFMQDQRHGVQAFGLGKWRCIGHQLAWAEMRLILARLVWAFDIKAADNPIDWRDLRTFFLYEKEPVPIKLSAFTDTDHWRVVSILHGKLAFFDDLVQPIQGPLSGVI